MKLVAFIFLMLILRESFAQSHAPFQTADVTSPELLTQLITSTDTTDRQKVTSIFNWITQNISYNIKRFENNSSNRYAPVLDEEEEDSIAPLRPLHDRVATYVLKRRIAVCGGYSNLFKSLCNYAGIRCEVITGFAKTRVERLDKRFTSNHRWNAVFLDTAWHLLDVTWASGYINYRNEFQRELNLHYFLTPPAEFIKDHYPEDQRWTLLSSPPLLNEFMYSPFKTSAFNRFYITSFAPATGVIDANVGDSIVFEIEALHPETLWISDLAYADSSSVFIMQCCGAVKPIGIVQGKKTSYTYMITSPQAEWLHVIYDDEIIMRYKLNIKKETPPEITPVTDTTKIEAINFK